MSVCSTEASEPSGATPRPTNQAMPLWAWLDVAPAAWLLLLISAYTFLTLADMVPTKRPVPGIPEADRLALPFLVLTVSAGIIRYFCLRIRDGNAKRKALSSDLGNRDTA